MFAIALEQLILLAMNSHIYSFNKKIHKQKSGGAIGNVLTGALATCFVIVWARRFREAVKEATNNLQDFEMYMLKIYVDDINMAAKNLPLGSRLIDGKIEIIESEIEIDRETPADVRTSRIFLEIANSVSSMRLTVDSPSLHQSGFMPILDVQIKIERTFILVTLG